MRKLLLSLILLACASGASAQCSNTSYGDGWTCVTTSSFFQNSNSGIASITTNINVNFVVGDLAIVSSQGCASVGCNVATNQTITISDNAGDTFTCPLSNPQVNFGGNIVGAVACYVCRMIGPPTQFTATNSNTAAGAFTRIMVTSWHNSGGAIPTSCLDQQSTSTFTTGSGTSAAFVTTSNTTGNNDLIYSDLMGTTATGVNNSFTQAAFISGINAEAKTGATPGSYPTGWTFASAPFFGDELAFFNPISSSGVPRKHGTFITFKPNPSHRIPWAFRPNRMRVETI